jgi:Bacterial archaeo-eukaryotic release factor family 5
VLDRFPERRPPPEGRGHVGFVDVADKPTEVWRSMQIPPRRTEVVHLPRPRLGPLIEAFNDGPRVGVVLVSAERVRLLEWELGAIRQLEEREIVLWSRDWRERKAERSVPGAGEWTSASGRDQFGQRLEANRQRFLHEVGTLVRARREERGWRHVLAFGPGQTVAELAEGAGLDSSRLHSVAQDLITAREGEVGVRVQAEIQEVNRTRGLALVREIEEAIGAATGAVLGPQDALKALGEGRVRHLVFDPERDHDADLEGAPAGDVEGEDRVPLLEQLMERAVMTGAEVTPLRGEPATHLDPYRGVAALLRY